MPNHAGAHEPKDFRLPGIAGKYLPKEMVFPLPEDDRVWVRRPGGRLFLPLSTPWSATCGGDRFVYPSLVDVRSSSRNFDVIGPDPYLYFVRQHFDGCQGTMQRDLVRMKVRLVGE